MTQQECADAWRKRWAEPAIELPSCYNREPFNGVWRKGCSSWFKHGGNAYMVGTKMIDKGGKQFPWSRCNGCKQQQKGNV
jgi:hypothetical protein